MKNRNSFSLDEVCQKTKRRRRRQKKKAVNVISSELKISKLIENSNETQELKNKEILTFIHEKQNCFFPGWMELLREPRTITQQQSIVKRQLEPLWNHEVTFAIPEGNCKNVLIEVFDADKFGKDKSIGKLDLQVAELINIDGQEGKWFPLSGVKSGQVLISAGLLDALGANAKGVPSSMLGRKDSELHSKGNNDSYPTDAELPSGKARINVIKAKELIKSDMIGKSDPYAVLSYGKQNQKTKVVKNTQEPHWNHEAEFNVPDGNSRTFNLEVFDSDKLGKDKSLGTLALDITDVLSMDGEEGRWFPLTGVKSGKVLLYADFLEAGSSDPADATGALKGLKSGDPKSASELSADDDLPDGKFRVNLIKAKELIKADVMGKSDPYATLKYGNQKFKTKIAENISFEGSTPVEVELIGPEARMPSEDPEVPINLSGRLERAVMSKACSISQKNRQSTLDIVGEPAPVQLKKDEDSEAVKGTLNETVENSPTANGNAKAGWNINAGGRERVPIVVYDSQCAKAARKIKTKVWAVTDTAVTEKILKGSALAKPSSQNEALENVPIAIEGKSKKELQVFGKEDKSPEIVDGTQVSDTPSNQVDSTCLETESHSNLLREHTDNINTFISTNATFTNQFIALETKSDDFLKYLQVVRQRIDNVESELNNLDETVQKAQPEIRRNTERIDELDIRQTNLGKNIDGGNSENQDDKIVVSNVLCYKKSEDKARPGEVKYETMEKPTTVLVGSLLDKDFKFRSSSSLQDLLCLNKTSEACWKLRDILCALKNFIMANELYDVTNPSIVLCDGRLEAELNVRSFHISQTIEIILEQLMSLEVEHDPVDDGEEEEEMNPSSVLPNLIKHASITEEVSTHRKAIFWVSNPLLKVLHTVEEPDKHRNCYEYGNVMSLISEYILKHKSKLFDDRNIFVADVSDDLLGSSLGVNSFHRCQINQLVRTKLTPVDDTEGTEMRSYKYINSSKEVSVSIMPKEEEDTSQTNLGKNLDDKSNQVQDNVKEIASLKQVLANQNNNLGDVKDRVKQNEDQIKHIDDTIDGLHKTVAIFEGRHVERKETDRDIINEKTISTNYPKILSNQERHISNECQDENTGVILENEGLSSSKEFVKIAVVKDCHKKSEPIICLLCHKEGHNQVDCSYEESDENVESESNSSEEFCNLCQDYGHSDEDENCPIKLKPITCLKCSIVGHMKADCNFPTPEIEIETGCQSQNGVLQKLHDDGIESSLENNMENLLQDKMQIKPECSSEYSDDSIRGEIHILAQHLEEVKSLHVATEKRIVEMDAGNQQLLEKFLGVEKELDGKLKDVNENSNSLITKLNFLDKLDKIYSSKSAEYYCETCYVDKFGKKCAQCAKVILGKGLRFGNESYHKDCFNCSQCSNPLEQGSVHSIKQKPICTACYELQFQETCYFLLTEDGLQCKDCVKITRSDDIQNESVTDNCKACELPINVKNLVFDGESNWHYKCFCCNQCNSALVNQKYYDKSGKLFCNNCFLAEHLPTCYNCKVEIKGKSGVRMNSTNGQVLTWHEDCLQCSVCQAGISLDNVVFRDNLFCKSCYLDTILDKCDKCAKPITGVGFTFREKFWHDTCFACDQCDRIFEEGKFRNLRDQKLCDTCFNDTKNDSQTNVNIQESIFIQTKQVKKVDAKRQQAEVRVKEEADALMGCRRKESTKPGDNEKLED